MSSLTSGVRKVILPNGLTVLLKRRPANPIAAVYVHVNVGYFNEPDEIAGISHVIEHMLFKGTRKRPGKEQIAQDVRAIGGLFNASTYYEETSYYIVSPSQHVASAVEILADMVQNSLIDSEELAREIEVILQESRQKRDNPVSMLIEGMYAQAHDLHRIRRWRIGEDEPLRALRSEHLHRFMQETYRPSNIRVVVVGDIDEESTLASIGLNWGEMVAGSLEKQISPQEPPRTGLRVTRSVADIQQRLLVFGFPAPHERHPDTSALSALGAVLSDGRSSRITQSLKERQKLINSGWADYEGFQAHGVFTMGAEFAIDDPADVETALFSELDRIVERGVTHDELARVKTRIESRQLYAQEEALGMARALAAYEALGGYALLDEQLSLLNAVTSEDIRRVCRDYLNVDKATLHEYLPEGLAAPVVSSDSLRSRILGETSSPGSTSSDVDSVPDRRVLEPNASMVFKIRRDLPLVSISVLWAGGKLFETRANSGITSLMLRTQLKGAGGKSALELAEIIEGCGSGIGITLGPEAFGFTIRAVADQVPRISRILRDVIREPHFDPTEIEKEKQALLGEIRRGQDNMFSRAYDLFQAACFGEQSFGMPANGAWEAVESITAVDLHAWHGQQMMSNRVVVSAVGDVDVSLLEEFGRAILGNLSRPVSESATEMAYLAPSERVDTGKRQQTASVVGMPGASLHSDDRYALDLVSEIASGLAGRLFQAVRGDRGLAYAVAAFHRSRKNTGTFATYTATAPENENLAREILIRELMRFAFDPVTDYELESAKTAIRGEYVVQSQTNGAQAAELANAELFGLPLEAEERYLAKVEAVTAKQLQAVATAYFDPDKLWMGVVRGE